MKVEQSGYAQQKFARALGERQRQCRIRRQPCQGREQQIAALLHTERTGYGERGAANGLAQAFQEQCIDPSDRVMNQLKNQIYLTGADQPADQAQ